MNSVMNGKVIEENHRNSPKVSNAKRLFTPGPLETTISVKKALLRDVGSRSDEMIATIRWIRKKLLDVAGVSHDLYTCVPIQGSGTFAVEAVLNTITYKDNSRVLIIDNGRYGERMEVMCQFMGVEFFGMRAPETQPVTAEMIEGFLREDNRWDIITIVHSETTTGVLNHVEEIGKIVKDLCPGAMYFVDSMSSFGAVPLDLQASRIDFMVSSANKCLEGVPGFAYTICRIDRLLECRGRSTSLCLDLVQQYLGFEKNGQFRFTPPTHCLLALKQALVELEAEGGVMARAKRYKAIQKMTCEGMELLGFKQYISENDNGCVVTCFIQPKNKNWNFEGFYQRLLDLDFVIYAGNTTAEVKTFRIGSMGRLTAKDVRNLLRCVKDVLLTMNIEVPVM